MRRRSVPALVLFVFALALGLATLASPAAAQDGDFAEIDMQLLGGVSWQTGDRVEARITVETSRAVSGMLTVDNDPEGGTSTRYEFDVDLAADSVATFPVVLTTGWEGVDATATLTSGGEVVADDEIRQFGDGAEQPDIVAVLGIDDPPRRIAEVGGDLQLIVLPLDARLRGLDVASSLVAAPASLRALGDDELVTVDTWIGGGGQLVVDGPDRSLEDRYHQFPTANPARFSFGAGSIVYAADWRDGVPLGGYLGQDGLKQLVENQQLGAGAAGELAILANIALPAVLLVVGALLLYSLVAGPLMFGVLSARRAQNLIWVLLPALSIVVAVAILGYGFASRTGRSEAHITIVEVNERGSRATTNLLLTSNIGSSRSIEAPAGWTYLGQGRIDTQRPVLVRPGVSSTDVAIDLPPGGNAIARFTGSAAEFDGLLTIEDAVLDGDEVTATVTNRGQHDLVEAVGFLGNARVEVGDIPAGETVQLVITTDDDRRTMQELLLWPRVRTEWGERGQVAVPTDRNAKTAAGAWTEWRIEQGTTFSPRNVVSVVGWTDGYVGPLEAVATGRTALVARANVVPDTTGPGWNMAVRLPARQGEPQFDGNFSGFVEDYRITLDVGTEGEDLALAVSADSAAVSVLIDDEWSWLALPDDGRTILPIPGGAVDDGEVRLRSHVPDFVWGAPATIGVVLEPPDQPAVLTDEPDYRSNGFDERFADEAVEFERRRDWFEEKSIEIEVPVADESYTVEDFISSDSHHAYVIVLEEGMDLTATMRSVDRDSYLELIGPDGELVASNDDFGQNVDSQIRYTVRDSGSYEIRAMELSGSGIDYQLSVEVAS